MKEEIMHAVFLIISIIIGVTCLFLVLYLPWYIGGIHLDELKITGMNKAKEICTSNIVEQGYQRSILSGFGGRRWYQCNIDGNLFQFNIVRRINSSEAQIYDLEQMTKFPSNFNINQD